MYDIYGSVEERTDAKAAVLTDSIPAGDYAKITVWNTMQRITGDRGVAYGIGIKIRQDKIVGDKDMHDNYIIGYDVKIKEKMLNIKIYDNANKKEKTYSWVLAKSYRKNE